jgi:hypothetical protein
MVCVLCVSGGAWVWGADGAESERLDGITTRGTVEVRQMATTMYFEAELIGVGATNEEAMADAVRRRGDFEKNFEPLKGENGSLEFFGHWSYTSGGRGPVQARLRLKAEWTLPGKTTDELRQAAQALERKVRSADLGWQQPEAGERAEPDGRSAPTRGAFVPKGGLEPPRGRAFFTFGSKLSDENYERALAGAFDDARRLAQIAVRAAHVELGPVRGLKATPPASAEFRNASTTPGELTYQISLDVTFDIKPGK